MTRSPVVTRQLAVLAMDIRTSVDESVSVEHEDRYAFHDVGRPKLL